MKTFANLAADLDAMRKVGTEDLGIAAEGLANQVKMATLLSAWSAAKSRSTEMDKVDAIQVISDRPKILLASDWDGMRDAYEAKFGELSLDKLPSRAMVETMLSSLEKKTFTAEKLTEVTTPRTSDETELRPVRGPDGTVRTVKKQASVPLPKNTEEFRERL